MKTLFIFVFLSGISTSQVLSQTALFFDSAHKIEFEIPDKWQMQLLDSKQEIYYVCHTTDSIEIEDYKNCFESVIFRLTIFLFPLDKYILEVGDYKTERGIIYASDRFNNDNVVIPILKENYKGFYHTSICGITCKESGFHAAAGECDFIIIGNSEKTIEISTNGKSFTEKVRKKIIDSINFK